MNTGILIPIQIHILIDVHIIGSSWPGNLVVGGYGENGYEWIITSGPNL